MDRLRAFSLAILFILTPLGAAAVTSVNVPVGSAVYRDIERLELKGLISSAMLSTKPFSRLETARLVNEAEKNWQALAPQDKVRLGEAEVTLQRLKNEFREELSGGSGNTYLRPERVYAKFLYSDKTPYFTDINNNGDIFRRGTNLRAGAAVRGGVFDTVSVYLNPEFRADGDDSRYRLLYGYMALDAAGARVEAGRDAMWWGSGAHGGLLVTDNARPFDMVKASSDHPFRLPWVFGYLGQLVPTVFLTHLEKNRDFPHANLLGMRLDFKPTPHFQIALNRVFMFGGEGRKSLTPSDWVKVFFVSDSAEHSDSPTNGNQIASIDASYVYANTASAVPFSGIKLYTEWGAEDSSGHTKTPTGRANLCGALIDGPLWLSNIDLRVEWANTARNSRYGPAWYKHGVYTSGYTYEGRVIGHHMGSDSRDLFLRLNYHMPSSVIGIEADRERSGIHSAKVVRRDWLAVDASYGFEDGMSVSGVLGIESVKDNAAKNRNGTAMVKLEYLF
ncbi:MAG: hypothetical protein HY889_06125 [Deltaproteobacteria bacterium]|nr:hypothetical protein [Deltaproteobacteria bacterium]